MIHLNAAYNLLSHLYTDVILQPLTHINEYIAMCDIIDHYTATNPTRKPLFIADRGGLHHLMCLHMPLKTMHIF